MIYISAVVMHVVDAELEVPFIDLVTSVAEANNEVIVMVPGTCDRRIM